MVASVWWTPSKWAVGSKVGPGVFTVGLTVCTGRGVGLIVSLAVGLIVGRCVVGGATGRGVAFTVGRAVVGGAEGRGDVVGGATGRGVALTVGRAVVGGAEGRTVVGAATGRGVAFTVGRAVVGAATGRGVVGAATGRGVAFTVGRAVGEGSAAAPASARNRSALEAMLTRSVKSMRSKAAVARNAGREGLLY